MTRVLGQELTENEKELYRRTDEVLHYLWDPIGIADEPRARDEYYDYLPKVFSLLLKTGDGKDIVDFLVYVIKDRMELSYTKDRRYKTEQAVNVLIKWRSKLS